MSGNDVWFIRRRGFFSGLTPVSGRGWLFFIATFVTTLSLAVLALVTLQPLTIWTNLTFLVAAITVQPLIAWFTPPGRIAEATDYHSTEKTPAHAQD